MSVFYYFWIATLLIKIVLSSQLPFFPDEAYYWVWSKHLQLSYYDHPAMIAWLFYLGDLFKSIPHGERIPGIILGHSTLLIWYQILKPYFSTRQLKWWFIASLFTPLSGLGSIIMTPDLPLLFFWSFSLFFLTKFIETPKHIWLVGLGSSMGLGFCSKYNMVLFPLILIAWFYKSHKHYKIMIQKSHIFTVIFFGLIFSLPVIIWNYHNDWASFLFQLNRSPGAIWKPQLVLEYIGSQILIIFPTFIYLSFQRSYNKKLSWLPYFAWAPIIFFLIMSFKGRVEANWTAVAIPAFIALGIFNDKNLKLVKSTVIIWILCLTTLIIHYNFPFLPFKEGKNKSHELKIYKNISPSLEEFTPLYASKYQMAASLTYYTGRPIYKLRNMSRIDQYDHFEESIPKETNYYLIAEKNSYFPEWFLNSNHKIISSNLFKGHFVIHKIKILEDQK